MRHLFGFPGALLLFLVDRWLKILALRGATVDLGPFQFALFENEGIIFSIPLPIAAALVLMTVAIGIVAYLGYRAWRTGNVRNVLACGLILLGAMSNLYDRVAYGFVVDWASFGPWWPVFNLADVSIAVGVIMMLWRPAVDKDRLTA